MKGRRRGARIRAGTGVGGGVGAGVEEGCREDVLFFSVVQFCLSAMAIVLAATPEEVWPRLGPQGLRRSSRHPALGLNELLQSQEEGKCESHRGRQACQEVVKRARSARQLPYLAFEGLQSVARGLAYGTQTWGVWGGLRDRPVAAVARHNLRRALIEEQCVWL